MNETLELAQRCQATLQTIETMWWRMPMVEDSGARLTRLGNMLGNPADLCVRPVGARATVLYLSTIVSDARVEESLLRPLANTGGTISARLASRLTPIASYGEAVQALVAGKAVAIARRVPGAFTANVEQWPQRQPTEPPAEVITRGPHSGFIESLDANVALVRRRVADPRLRYETFAADSTAGTRGGLVYVEGIVAPAVLERVRRALRHVHPSVVTDASVLAQHLSPRAYLFPTIGSTERPDVAQAALLEGRVVIFTDGSPTALLLPQVFAHLLSVPDDYYNRSPTATYDRLFRLFGLVGTLTVAAFYVAIASVNMELVPTPLFLSISQARLGVPMPLVFEIVALEATIELIRQAGLRLPSSFGQSISVVGAVVIGQSAVMAGLLSAPAVVVVSLEFIASFIVPSQTTVMALRMLRFPLIFLAATLGLFGLVFGLMLLLVYLSSLESFGVPYLAPVIPLRPRGLQDTVVRIPLPELRRSFLARSATKWS